MMQQRKDKLIVAHVSYRNVKAVAILFSLILFVAAISQAQLKLTPTASVSGIVSDPSGAVVPGAKVTVTDTARGEPFSTQTNESGVYLVKGLIPSTYKITAAAPGFSTYVLDSFPMTVDQQAVLNIALQVGTASQTVEVKGQAQMVEPSNATLAGVINTAEIADLPLSNRNILTLAAIEPGVTPSTPNSYTSNCFTCGDRYAMNGGLENTSDFQLDGISILIQADNGGQLYLAVVPSVDGVGEISVNSHNFSASYGRSGGGIVSMVTKSGTNAIHGSLFDFTQNTALEANNFFSNEVGGKMPPLHYDQYGGSVGGPVIKNKVFFFFDYERNLNHLGQYALFSVPTVAERAGDFSQDYNSAGQVIQLYNPFSTRPDPSNPGQYIRDPVPNNNLNDIPGFSMDPVAVKAVSYYPRPNLPGTPIPGTSLYTTVNNFGSSVVASSPVAEIIGRGDFNFSSTARAFVGFAYSGTTGGAPAFFGPDNPANTAAKAILDSDHVALGYTKTFGAKTVLDVRAGIVRSMELQVPLATPFNDTTLGLPQALQTYELGGMGGISQFPGIYQEGYSGLDAPTNSWYVLNHLDWVFSGNATRVMGKHFLSVGAEARVFTLDVKHTFPYETTFSNDMTQGPNPRVISAAAGDSIASFLLGTADSGSASYVPYTGESSRYYAQYIQDDFKVTRKLTVNLGFRMEEESMDKERFNRLARMDLTVLNPISSQVGFNVYGGYVFAGNGPDSFGSRDAAPPEYYANPRIGLAYMLNDKTVIRAGAGIFYSVSNYAATSVFTSPAWSTSTPEVATADGITPLNRLSNPFPSGFVYPPGPGQGLLTGVGTGLSAAFPQGAKTPSNTQANFSIQRSLSPSLLLQLAYVYNKGTHLQLDYPDENQLPPQDMGPASLNVVSNPFAGLIPSGGLLNQPTVLAGELELPYPGWTSVGESYSGWGNSEYNALQIRLQKRYTSGVTFIAGYTWSKLMSEITDGAFGDGPLEWWSGGSSSLRSVYCFKCEESVSSYDVPHRFTLSGVAELPFGRGKRFGSSLPGYLNHIAGGWQANMILTLGSGMPLTLVTAVNNSYAFGGGQHVDAVPGVRANSGYKQSVNEWFNTAAFRQPANFTFGNLGREFTPVREDWTRNADLSLFKNFTITEKVKLQFRAEAYNFTNTPVFAAPNTYYGAPGFGAISSQSNLPRTVQLGLKLTF